MRSIARLVTRMQGEGDGLMLGVTLNGHNFFKPSTVYELRDVLGVITIVEIGPALPATEGQRYTDSPIRVHWASNIEDVMCIAGKTLYLSQDEYQQHLEQWEAERERDL